MPQWHGQEMLMLLHEQNLREREKVGSATASPNVTTPHTTAIVEPLQLRWRHIQALVRLTQVVHVLADVITDWEAIMDSFEQLMGILLNSASLVGSSTGSSTKDGRALSSYGSLHAIVHDELTPNEIDKISQCIERFKGYTIFMSDEALVRLMTSLVALSLNALAVSATSTIQSSSGNGASASSSGNSSSPAPGTSIQKMVLMSIF